MPTWKYIGKEKLMKLELHLLHDEYHENIIISAINEYRSDRKL